MRECILCIPSCHEKTTTPLLRVDIVRQTLVELLAGVPELAGGGAVAGGVAGATGQGGGGSGGAHRADI